MSCTIDTSTTDDEIRSQFTLKAPIEKVWAALTTREGWSGWFSADIETDFQVGSEMVMDFGKWGTSWGLVAEREEMRVFAYKWHPGDSDTLDAYPREEMTTVRFEIQPVDGGTQVVMTESGFKNIPGERRVKALGENTQGWESELQEMVDWVEQGKRHTVPPKE